MWYWRLRLAMAGVPVVVFVMDAPAFAVFAMGTAFASAVWVIAPRVAAFEARVRSIRALREHR